eukprot:14411955-Alexandrium_andersonii.AAC.1
MRREHLVHGVATDGGEGGSGRAGSLTRARASASSELSRTFSASTMPSFPRIFCCSSLAPDKSP